MRVYAVSIIRKTVKIVTRTNTSSKPQLLLQNKLRCISLAILPFNLRTLQTHITAQMINLNLINLSIWKRYRSAIFAFLPIDI